MDLEDVMSAEQFANLYRVTYSYNYMNREIKEEIYYPTQMPEVIYLLWNKLSRIDYNRIKLASNINLDGKLVSELFLTKYIYDGVSARKDQPINLLPTLDQILNFKYPVFALNYMTVDLPGGFSSSMYADAFTLLLTNTYPTLESVPNDFKQAVFSVVDIRRLTPEQWGGIILPKISNLDYRDDSLSIYLKEPIIKLMGDM